MEIKARRLDDTVVYQFGRTLVAFNRDQNLHLLDLVRLAEADFAKEDDHALDTYHNERTA
jgi:hypothetical protein